MYIMLLSNFSRFHLTYTNINSIYDHNNENHNDDIILEYTNGSKILSKSSSEIDNINNNGNSNKIDAVTTSNINIDDTKLPLKKRKLSCNFQGFKNDISVQTNHLIQTASVSSKQISDNRSLDFQKINAANNEKDKEIIDYTINQHIYSYNFINLFKIIESDLKNCLKYGCLYVFEDNNIINQIIFRLENPTDFKNKIINFINILNNVLETNFHYKQALNDEKLTRIKLILNSSKNKNTECSRIREKKTALIRALNKSIIRNEIDFNDIFDAKYLLLQKINDDSIMQLCIIGLQNLYNRIRHGTTPNFFDILILLYFYKYKRQYFNLDWSDYFFKLLSFQYRCYSNLIYFNKIKKWVFKVDKNVLCYGKYIIMNSFYFEDSIQIYDSLSQNQSELNLIHYLIDKLNQVKSKIYLIRNIQLSTTFYILFPYFDNV